MKKNIRVLSLFDGISVAQQALKELGYTLEYYASEIDEYAIAVTQANHPNTMQIGDVSKIIWSEKNKLLGFDSMNGNKNWITNKLPEYAYFDLLIGGSPCQDISIAKRGRKGLDGERSGLFYEYVRIRDKVKPKYFILENVASMSKESKDKISEVLGVQPVIINASLVSAQHRKRLYWVGAYSHLDNKYYTVAIPQPEDRGIILKDIILDGVAEREKSLVVTATYSRACPKDYFGKSNRQLIKVGEFNKDGQGDRVYSVEGKSVTLSSNGGGRGAKTGLYETTKGLYRKLHPIECLRLQSMPDNYFDKAIHKGKPISNTQKYKMCGNAFNCAVIEHILKQLKI